MVIWLAAAASLIIGIVIGFASGYAAGQRGTLPAAAIGILGTSSPDTAAEPVTTSGRAFSEGAVQEPERVDPEEIRSTPDPDADRSDAERSNRPVRSDGSNRSGPEDSGSARPDAPNVNVSNASVPNVPNVPTDPNDRRPGSIDVLSRPAGAEVVLDGRIIGRTPLSMSNVPPGPHSIRLELPGFNRWATSVEIDPGARTRVAASLEQP